MSYLDGTPYVSLGLASTQTFYDGTCNLVYVFFQRQGVDVLEDMILVVSCKRLPNSLDQGCMPLQRRVQPCSFFLTQALISRWRRVTVTSCRPRPASWLETLRSLSFKRFDRRPDSSSTLPGCTFASISWWASESRNSHPQVPNLAEP